MTALGYVVTVTPGGPDVVDLGGPDGGRYWRVVESLALDHEDVRSAAVNGRLTGSVGCTYNEAKVERVEVSRQEVATLDEALAVCRAVDPDDNADVRGPLTRQLSELGPEGGTVELTDCSITVEKTEGWAGL